MILILNCGSQSIKWKLFDEKNLKSRKEGGRDVSKKINYQRILEQELGRLEDYKEKISTIGHRFVHGGGRFKKPVKITPEVLKELRQLNALAPLHNPYNVLGIEACLKIFCDIPQIAVFDTEFYKNLAPKVYTYALPEDLAEKYGFRRYGFHGLSHEYAAKEGARILGKHFNKLRIITCHLGGGSSISAIKNGRIADTSMGFTPTEGVVMMTRCGSIDPGIILEIAKNYSLEKTEEILNSESGVKGICGCDKMLDVLKKIKKKDKKARLALDVFVYSIQKQIGAYLAVLGGCDLLVFTGAIGFGSRKIRNMICRDLNFLKKTNVLAVKADEESMILKKIKSVS